MNDSTSNETGQAAASSSTDRQGEPRTFGEYNGFEVYPMPFFVTIEVADVRATAEWYRDRLGFGVMYNGPEVDGQPMMAHLRRSRYQDILVVPARDAVEGDRAGRRITVSMPAEGEVDAIASRLAEHGDTFKGPEQTPYNVYQVTVTDPDGFRLTLFEFRPTNPNGGVEEFDAVMERTAETPRQPR